MDADNLINAALQQGSTMIGGTDLFVLEANAELNKLRVIALDEMYKNNIMAFMYNINHGFIVVGVFTTKEAAEEMIITIRTLFKNDEGELLR